MDMDELLPDGTKRYQTFGFRSDKLFRWGDEIWEVDEATMKELHRLLDKYVK